MMVTVMMNRCLLFYNGSVSISFRVRQSGSVMFIELLVNKLLNKSHCELRNGLYKSMAEKRENNTNHYSDDPENHFDVECECDIPHSMIEKNDDRIKIIAVCCSMVRKDILEVST